MPRSLRVTLFLMIMGAVAITARGSITASATVKSALESRFYCISDLPVYRRSPDGEYTIDTSAIQRLTTSIVDSHDQYRVSADKGRWLMVHATVADHESLQTVLQALRNPAAN